MNRDQIIGRARAVLGRNVETLREKEGLSAAALARACSIPEGELHAIERGERDVPLDTLTALASRLGVTLSALFES